MIAERLASGERRSEGRFESLRGLSSPRLRRQGVLVLLGIGLYVFLAIAPLPVLNAGAAARRVQDAWFLALIDALASGGALGRGGLAALGVLPYILTHRRVRQAGRSLRAPHFLRVVLEFWRVVLSFSALFCLALLAMGVLPLDAFNIVIAVFALALGSLLVHSLDIFMRVHRGPTVLLLNVSFILAGSIYTNARGVLREGPFSPGGLYLVSLLVSGGAYAWLRLRKRTIRLVNIATGDLQRGEMPVPRLFTVSESSLLVWLVYLSVFFGLFAQFALNLQVDPFEITPATLAINLVFLAALYLVMRGYNFASVFSATELALRLVNNFWVIPDVPAGKPTAAYLREALRQAQLTTFAFYAATFGLWFLAAFAARALFGQSLALPFGPLGVTFILVLSIDYLANASRRITQERHVLGERLSDAAVSIPAASSRDSHEDALALQVMNGLLADLGEVIPREMGERVVNTVQDYRAGRANEAELIMLGLEMQRSVRGRASKETPAFVRRRPLRWLLFSTLAASGITAVIMTSIAIVVRLFFPGVANSQEYRLGLWMTAIPIWFGLLIEFGPQDMLKELVARWTKGR